MAAETTEQRRGTIYGLFCRCHHGTGHRYVGQTITNPQRRFNTHKAFARRGDRTPVHCWMRKHGVENIYWMPLRQSVHSDDLDRAEIQTIRAHKAVGRSLLNVETGGTRGGQRRGPLGAEHRQQLSLALTGKKRTPEMRESQSARFRELGMSVGDRNSKAKLTWDDVDAIRATPLPPAGPRGSRGRGAFYRALAEQFGVSYTSIYSIISNKTWTRYER